MSRSDTHSLIDRVFIAHRELKAARMPIPAARLREALGEASSKQLRRTLHYLRDVLQAPLDYDKRAKGWHYDRTAPAFELPGLWFTPSELHALLVSEDMLAASQPGILTTLIQPLRSRIHTLLARGIGAARTPKIDAVRVTTPMLRPASARIFAAVAQATLSERKLAFAYHARSHDTIAQRLVSPVRLEHYRGNWYLLAWCHSREAWRHFSMDRIEGPTLQDQPIAAPAIENERPYGLFDAPATDTAVLRFTPERAKWISGEIWHAQQQGVFLENGIYELRVPYGNDTELILDIARYGPDVEVIAPQTLRDKLSDWHRRAAAIYTRRSGPP